MLLVTAILKSLHGIATRRRTVLVNRRGKETFEYQMAVVSDRGVVHVFNGRNGTIRRLDAADQARDDWEPFQERVEHKPRKFKKAVQ